MSAPTTSVFDVYSTSIALKVHGGTVRSDVNLCATCSNAHRMIGAHTGRETVSCHANYQNPMPLREGAARCNRYVDSRQPSLQQMSDIAWTLMTDKGGRTIGFLSPEELRDRAKVQGPVGF